MVTSLRKWTILQNNHLKKIQRVFPSHRIRSEEIGDNYVQSDWMWMIDPLDGTNNFAVGMPLFSISVTLLYQQKPVLAVIYEPGSQIVYMCPAGMKVPSAMHSQ